ncbi:MAG: TetR/AcrR family transcriptional regulator [Desulfosudaceae bacterium]
MAEKKNKDRPKGRDAVRRALIESAAALFAERGVSGVSLREIAAQAGVNHGLIHRHFGSKENLRKKTQEYLAGSIREEIGSPDNLIDLLGRAEEAIQKHPLFWKVMARSFLDGTVEGDLQSEFPFVRDFVEAVRTSQQQGLITLDVDPRYIVAAICAYGLGMRAFEGYIMEAAGLGEEPVEEVLAEIRNRFISFCLA